MACSSSFDILNVGFHTFLHLYTFHLLGSFFKIYYKCFRHVKSELSQISSFSPVIKRGIVPIFTE